MATARVGGVHGRRPLSRSRRRLVGRGRAAGAVGSAETTPLEGRLYEWYRGCAVRESAALAALREETRGRPGGHMHVAPEQAQFLAFLVRLMGARRVLEVGTFTGYSALAMAEALPRPEISLDEYATVGLLPPTLLTLERDAKVLDVAFRHWQDAGVWGRADGKNLVESRLGDAAELLEALRAEPRQASSYDLCFVDADKKRYAQYLDLCLGLVRPGGVIIVDNVLWYGRVADPDDTSAVTAAIRDFVAEASSDPRVESSLVPLGDGMLLLRRKERDDDVG